MLHPKIEAKLAQKIILTPALQQAIRLLQLNRVEIIEFIKNEVEQNPVIEEVTSDSSIEEFSGKKDDIEKIDFEAYLEELYEQFDERPFYFPSEGRPAIENVPAPQMGLQDYLIWQLNLLELPVEIKNAVEYLIENLNADGYLIEPLEKLSNENYPYEILKRAKNILMSMDPLGIGAENIKECLIFQAQTEIVKKALQEGWEEILAKDNEGLKRKLKVSDEELFSILSALRFLDPFPGRRFGERNIVYVEPDIFVFKKGNSFEVSVNEDGLPKLRISKFYLRLLRNPELVKDKIAKNFIESKLQSAFLLLKSLEQRKKTLLNVSKSIVSHQAEAIEKGLNYLKPLLLKTVAEEVGVHESTVSRIVANKYLLAPAGIFLMRDFFTLGVKTVTGEMKSIEELKKAISEIIEKEDKKKPLKDCQIADILYRKYKISIARRTVAKYREELRIPNYKERKRSDL